jgi:hypothetical protein
VEGLRNSYAAMSRLLSPADERGDLRLLRRELFFRPGRPLAGAFPGGPPLDPRQFRGGTTGGSGKQVPDGSDPSTLARRALAMPGSTTTPSSAPGRPTLLVALVGP